MGCGVGQGRPLRIPLNPYVVLGLDGFVGFIFPNAMPWSS